MNFAPSLLLRLLLLPLLGGLHRYVQAEMPANACLTDQYGLCLMPNLNRPQLSWLQKSRSESCYMPFHSSHEIQKLRIRLSSFLADREVHPDGQLKSMHQINGDGFRRRIETDRWLRSLLAIVRLPAPATGDQPGGVRLDVDRLQRRLVGDVMNPLFQMDLVGLDKAKLEELESIARDEAAKLNRLLMEMAGAADLEQLIQSLQHLLTATHEKIRSLRDQLLPTYARLAQRLLRVLTGRLQRADRLLTAAGLQALTAGRRFRVWLPVSWRANPTLLRLEELPLAPPSPRVSQPMASQGAFGLVFDRHLASTDFQGLRFVSNWVGQFAEGASGQPQDLTLRQLAAFAIGAYVRHLIRSLDEEHLDDLNYPGTRITFSEVDVMLNVCDGGITVDEFELFRELFVEAYPGRSQLHRSLLALERYRLQTWDLGDGFDLRTNLLLGRMRRSRLPAALSDGYSGPPRPLRLTQPERLPFQRGSFAKMEHHLASLQTTDLAETVARQSLEDLRIWLVFAVIRALLIMLNQASGVHGNAQFVPGRTDYLFRYLIRTDVELHLDQVAEIAADGCLLPNQVALILRCLMREPHSFYARMSSVSEWTVASHLDQALLRFRPRPELASLAPDELPCDQTELLHQIKRRLRDWLRTAHAGAAAAADTADEPEPVETTSIEKAIPVLLYGELPWRLAAEVASANDRLRAPGSRLSDEQFAEMSVLFKRILHVDLPVAA